METNIPALLKEANQKLEKACQHAENILYKTHAHKTNTDMLHGILVDYYGQPTPISQMASITTPTPTTLSIKPWEKKLLGEIEKALLKKNHYDFILYNDGEQIKATLPSLSEERRLKLVHEVKNKAEEGRVQMRLERQEIRQRIKKLEKEGVSEDETKRAETELQKITDKFIKKLEDTLAAKEKELMTV